MDEKERSEIATHMAWFGTRILAIATYHSHLRNYEARSDSAEMAVVEAAHAAEILVKARVAFEHPLLIFENVPFKNRAATLEDLLEGRTVNYADLPTLLLQTTGQSIDAERFREFGRLRNRVQHFLPPKGVNLGLESLRFIYAVLDPFIHSCWGLYAVDYNDDYDPYIYLLGALGRHEIEFLVSPKAAEHWKSAEFYEAPSPTYLRRMNKRVVAAGGDPVPIPRKSKKGVQKSPAGEPS